MRDRPGPRGLRFSVGGLLYLTACLSVALALVVPPAGIGEVDWYSLLLTLAALGLATELINQASSVWGEPRFYAAGFARWTTVAALGSCIALQAAERFGVFIRPERDGPVWGLRGLDLILDYLVYPLLVAAASMLWARPRATRTHPGMHRVVLWAVPTVFALAYLAFWVRSCGLFTYLVHLSTNGIEIAQAVQWRRQGAFVDHARESFFTSRAATAAAGGVAVAAVMVLAALHDRKRSRQRFTVLAFACLAVLLAGYVGWWWWIEFPRVSPDLAGAPFAANAWDGLGGVMLAVTLTAWIACRLNEGAAGHSNSAASAWFGTIPVWLVSIGLIVGGFIFLIQIASEWINAYGLWNAVHEFLVTPLCILHAAVFLAGLRLLPMARSGEHSAVRPINGPRAAAAFGLLITLFGVGAPTLAAYSVASWLGPWWR